jgi:hypothetical protein
VSGVVPALSLDKQREVPARFGKVRVQGQHGAQRLLGGCRIPAFLEQDVTQDYPRP